MKGEKERDKKVGEVGRLGGGGARKSQGPFVKIETYLIQCKIQIFAHADYM